jgi:hypothetical protein
MGIERASWNLAKAVVEVGTEVGRVSVGVFLRVDAT